MRQSFLLLLLIVVSACSDSETNPITSMPESNFAFTFEYGSCNRDVLDTFNGTYTRDMIVDEDFTVPFRLTSAQMSEIYQEMVAIDLWNYPEVFSIPIPENETVGFITPAMEYRITLQNGESTKTVSWIDEITEPTKLEAEKLRALFSMIIAMIQNNSQYQGLPEPEAACL